MKKLLVLLFLCSFLPIFAADSAPVKVILENDDVRITLELQRQLYKHFTKEKSKLIGLVRPELEYFKNNPDVYAFYDINDNHIYFKDKDIASKLNDKYVLNSVIHELTHFYQNNYGNKLPEGGTPNAQAMLLHSKNKEIVIRHSIETLKQWEMIYSKTVFSWLSEVDKSLADLEKKYQEEIDSSSKEHIKNTIDELKNLKKKLSTADNGWSKFLKGAIAEGTACLVGTFISNTFWVQDSWFDVPQTVGDIYLDIYIPICIAYNRSISKDSRWDIIAQTYKTMVLHRRKRGIGNSELEEYQISYNPFTLFGGITFTHSDFRKSLKKITLKQLLKSVERN